MDNWQRIDSVIRWANMTINYFALYIGLPRGENLYQIKREIMVFPGTWPTRSWPNSRKSAWRGCLPARGRCLWTRNYAGCKFRFIRRMLNLILRALMNWLRIGKWWFRNWRDAIWLCCITERLWDILFRPDRSCSWKNDARGDYSRTRIRDCLSKIITLRIVRTSERDSEWRLVAADRENFDDIFVKASDIEQVYQVVGKLEIKI